MPDFSFESELLVQGFEAVGVDEVGRGCLAGPVVAAAVKIPIETILKQARDEFWNQLDDSKKLSALEREEFSKKIFEHSYVQIAWAFPDEIDKHDILRASLLAMRRAVKPFKDKQYCILVDGNLDPYSEKYKIHSEYDDDPTCSFRKVINIIKGDSKSVSIAAASIVAKVYRDRWMDELDKMIQGYHFSKHKGYLTKAHTIAIHKLGPSKIHRLSFAPFKNQ